MEQKIVSFKVAKAIKKAGYPQGNKNSGNCDVYPLEDHDDNYTSYTRIGKITTRYKCETWRILSSIPYVVAPTYLEVWLWLWREKNKSISIICDEDDRLEANWYVNAEKLTGGIGSFTEQVFFSDPEEAIIAAIEYLVDNDLIK